MPGAFIPLAHLDVTELAYTACVKRVGEFREVKPGHRILRARGHVKDSSPDEDRFGTFPTVAKGWPELSALRDEIKARAEALFPPGIDLGLVFFEMIDAGAALAWRGEVEPYYERWSRAMITLRSNPGLTLVCGGETMTPAVGMLNVVSPRLPRAALNQGEHAVVWLTIDFRRRTEAP
jgi:hypothetical protein